MADQPSWRRYDPVWRPFQGRMAFAPHPWALQTAAERSRPPAYVAKAGGIPDGPAPAAAAPAPSSLFAGLGARRMAALVAAGESAEVPEHALSNAATTGTGAPAAPGPDGTGTPLRMPGRPAPATELPVQPPLRPPGWMPASNLAQDEGSAAGAVRPATPGVSPHRLAVLYGGVSAVPAARRRRLPRWAMQPVTIAAVVTSALLAGVAVALALRLLVKPASITGLFTAPVLVLQAAGAGQVTSVSVTVGQAVEPGTTLLTLRADAAPDATRDDLRNRLAQARARQSALDDPAMRRQAAADVEQLQRAVASGAAGADQPILAGVRGVVWSLDAAAGGRLHAGDPVAQLADCARAFLVLPGHFPELQTGRSVMVRMPGLPPFRGVMRPSSGPAEPADALVVEPTGFAALAPAVCPVGVAADIRPDGA